MTSHKHFKQFVRARMEKTGEAYTTARRYLLHSQGLHQLSIAAASAIKAELGAVRWHLPGCIPGATALRILLTAAGIRDPRTNELISEPLAFGIAGGIGIGVAAFFYESADFASFYVAGRHLWHDEQAYLENALQRFGLSANVSEAGGTAAGFKNLKAALADGQPCVAWVDMAHLPHRGLPRELSGGGYHVITIYDIDEEAGTARIGDLADEPIRIALAELATARARIKKFKNRLLTILEKRESWDLERAIRSGIAACARGLTGKPMKNYPNMFNLDSLAQWAGRMYGSKDKENWERVFPRGHRLWSGLTMMYDYIENYFTGGGLCRPIFSQFLADAASALGDSRLNDLSLRYAALGKDWSDLAIAALPQSVPMFKKAVQTFELRHELLAEAGESNIESVRASWARLSELKAESKECFPISEKQVSDLLKDLQARVYRIHEREVAALAEMRQLGFDQDK